MAKPQSPQKRELMLGVKQFLGGYGCECGGGDSRRELKPRVVEQRLHQATVQQGRSQGVRLLLEPPIGLTWWEEKGQGRPGVHSSEVSPPGPGAGWGKVGGHRRGQQKLFSTAPLWAEGKADVQAGRRSLGRVFNLQKSSSVSLDLQARGRLLASHTDHLQSGSSPETPISARLFSAVQVPAGEADQRKSTRSTFESRTILSCLASTGKRFYWVPLLRRVLSGR